MTCYCELISGSIGFLPWLNKKQATPEEALPAGGGGDGRLAGFLADYIGAFFLVEFSS